MVNWGLHNRWITTRTLFLTLLAISALGQVAGVTVEWAKNPEPTVTGYRVHYGETNRSPTSVNVGNTTRYSVNNLTPGRTYYFYITAYNSYDLESDPSARAYYKVPESTISTSAAFVRSDATTSGSWQGMYGSQGGLAYPNGHIPYPENVAVSAYRNYAHVWDDSTTDPRALQKSSGSDRFATAWHDSSEFYFFLEFSDADVHQVSFYFLDYDRAGRQQKLEFFDDVTGQLLASTNLANFQNGIYSTWNLKGNVQVRVTRISGPNAVLSGIFFDPEGTDPASTSAAFVRTDTTTSGSWRGVYGSDGAVAHPSGYLPAPTDVQVNAYRNYPLVWSYSTTDPRALQKASGTDRFATAWNDPAEFYFYLQFSDADSHQVSFYFLDYERAGRQQKLEFFDHVTGRFLGSTNIASFQNGIYSTWNLRGKVRVKMTRIAGPNTVLSGIFFDPGSAPATGTAAAYTAMSATSYVAENTSRGGTWKAELGTEGHSIAAEEPAFPSYGALNLAGVSEWIWSLPSSDPAALERPYDEGRIASAWYASDPFTVDLELHDSNPHRVSLYFVDFDGAGRTQLIEVLDPNTGTVLDSTELSEFGDGVWLQYVFISNTAIRITPIEGQNAVLSGIFFDPPAN